MAQRIGSNSQITNWRKKGTPSVAVPCVPGCGSLKLHTVRTNVVERPCCSDK
ncbi:hypothetical protein M378DRAFT_162693 [Amanita muscaria Koide BX008]|uniref:Uncharacterized protein n=1 Tax=Amanita muscaria (strain Koide BX008) TaxID=946122 RepID=A0A0C2TDE1_AMAMK|nr:hypothetical protein M378DRAFT_162693 [Amanita muscaria Koide BX008]